MVERAAGICGAVVVTDEIERLVFGNHEVAGSNLAVGRSENNFFQLLAWFNKAPEGPFIE